MNFKEFEHKNPDGFSFHIREWSPDTEPVAAVFLIHGLADHGGRFEHVASGFFDSNMVFFAPDLRGNGRTGGKRGHFCSADQVMNDIHELVLLCKKRWPRLPLVVYGQSMGGNLCINYCLRHPAEVSCAVSSSPWLRLTRPPNKVTRIAGKVIGSVFPSLQLPNGLNAGDLSHSEQVAEAYRKDPLVHGKITLGTFEVISRLGEEAISHAGRFSVPLLIMHGTADQITSIDATRQFTAGLVSRFDYEEWEGMRHELHNETENQPVLNKLTGWVLSNK